MSDFFCSRCRKTAPVAFHIHESYIPHFRKNIVLFIICHFNAPDNNVGVGAVTVLGDYGSDGLLLRCRIKRTGQSAKYEFSPA